MPSTENQTSSRENVAEVQPFICKCEEHKEKPQNLAMRLDLAGEEDGHSKLALCIFAKPPAVHEWDGKDYVIREDLEFKNNQIVEKESGAVYASTTPPSLADLDTDDEAAEDKPESGSSAQGGPTPACGQHVDLDQDEYY
ncbi:hypothetical protein KAU09_01300 [Candidatus Parcubacteria bacterium]|nr:hypothetical protein [Candidatus Parcubacteria bacterium]